MKLSFPYKDKNFIINNITQFADDITELHLCWNKLRTITDLNLTRFKNLTRLNLSYNEIEHLPKDLIKYLPPTLESLNLSFNKIKELSLTRFPMNLKELRIMYNEITYIDDFIPPYSLKSIELQGNPLYAYVTTEDYILKYLMEKRKYEDLHTHYYYSPPTSGGEGYKAAMQNFQFKD